MHLSDECLTEGILFSQIILDKLDELHSLLADASCVGALTAFSRRLCAPLTAELGWTEAEEEGTERRLLRARVLRFACTRGDADALAAAKERLDSWRRGSARAPVPNLRSVVYSYGIAEVSLYVD